jgi:hypothetical protein
LEFDETAFAQGIEEEILFGFFRQKDWNGKPGTVFYGMRQNRKNFNKFYKTMI